MGSRLRERREHAKLSLGQVAEYEQIGRQYLSKLELGVNEPPTWGLLARLAERYKTSTDYLLGLTDDPLPHHEELLPEVVWELVELLEELPEEVQAHVVAYAQTLVEAERRANLREYDRMMAVVLALPEGHILREAVEEALRAGAGGDTAAAFAVIDAYLAGREARDAQAELQQQPVEQG